MTYLGPILGFWAAVLICILIIDPRWFGGLVILMAVTVVGLDLLYPDFKNSKLVKGRAVPSLQNPIDIAETTNHNAIINEEIKEISVNENKAIEKERRQVVIALNVKENRNRKKTKKSIETTQKKRATIVQRALIVPIGSKLDRLR